MHNFQCKKPLIKLSISSLHEYKLEALKKGLIATQTCVHSSDENFNELICEWFSIIFRRLLIDFVLSFVWSSLDKSRTIP
jgi:hypothetical protein